ncbi:agmatinase [Candidatus Pacearchaeota archaeon]|nr:agmatinase [Candidatus Pacearchaeota archaeon]
MNVETKEILSFYCNAPINNFSSSKTLFKDAKYAILGVPYDKSSTYRPGSRFAPSSIRDASLNIETYSLKADLDLEELKICDIGDLNIVDSLEETLRRLGLVIAEVAKTEKIPIMIGGEHTITSGSVQAFKKNFGIVIFDAHLDSRDEFMGSKLSHATFIRRLIEKLGPENIILVGTRAVCKEEVKYAKKIGLSYITTHEIQQNPNKIVENLKSRMLNFKNIYISLDMDVLDPSYAPAVGNPEGFGLNLKELMDIMVVLCNESLIGFDLVEVSPHYDQGMTAIQAAKIIFEVVSQFEGHRKEV